MNNTQKLFTLASEAAKNAYAPYSNFAVGAALMATDGNFYVGCNVENASFPVGTCAEAGAIAAMVAAGSTRIAEILIFADSAKLISPCGACRQRIAEFAAPETPVHFASPSGIQKTCTIAELLPCQFSEF